MLIDIGYDKSTKIEEDDLIGDIRILSVDGSIEEMDTYIDAWLYSLIDLYCSFKNGKGAKLDLVDEPNYLIGQLVGSGFLIQYKMQKIIFNDLDEFGMALKAATQKIKNDFMPSIFITNNDMYKKIIEFSD